MAAPIFKETCAVPKCWGWLEPISDDELVCLDCGNVVSRFPPENWTEADHDIFSIPGGKLSALELAHCDGWVAPSAYGRDRGRADDVSTNEDIDQHPPTTRFPWGG